MNRTERRKLERELKKPFKKQPIDKRIDSIQKNHKQITFSELHKLSIENYGRFNSNIYTEKLKEDFPQINENTTFVIENVMVVKKKREKLTETYYLTRVHNHTDDNSNIPLYQDLSIEQWNSLLDIPPQLLKQVIK